MGLLSKVMNVVNADFTPNVSGQKADGGTAGDGYWFLSHYEMMRTIGLWLLMPLLLISVIHAIAKGSMQLLLRSVLVYLPLSLIGSVVAVSMVQLLLGITDDFCKIFLGGINNDAQAFFGRASSIFGLATTPPIFTIAFGAAMIVTTVALFIILAMREASIYIATAFLPIGFALLVWPTTSRWLRRMVEFLVGLILSKLVIVAALALAVAASVSAYGLTPTAASGIAVTGNNIAATAGGVQNPNAPGEVDWTSRISDGITALTVFIVADLAPGMTINLVGNIGLAEMAAALTGAIARPSSMRAVLQLDRTINTFNAVSGIQGLRRERRTLGNGASGAEQRLTASGVLRGEDGTYRITKDELDEAGVEHQWHQTIMDMTDPTQNRKDANRILMAHRAMAMGDGFGGWQNIAGGGGTAMVNSKTGRTDLQLDITDQQGRLLDYTDRTVMRQARRTVDLAMQGKPQAVRLYVPMVTRKDQMGVTRANTPEEQRAVNRLGEWARNASSSYNTPISIVQTAPATLKARLNESLDHPNPNMQQPPKRRRAGVF